MPNDQIRMSIVGNIYHQVPGHNPSSFSLRSKRTLKTKEEPYLRSPPKPLDLDWTVVDLGWLKSCSVLCIRNLEKLDEDNHLRGILELGIGNVSLRLRIPPGMTTVVYPEPEEILQIRCLWGPAHYTIYALPE